LTALTALILVMAVSATVGFVSGRVWVVPIAAGAIVAFYAGLDRGLWGSGTGDGWQIIMVAMAALNGLLTAGAVAVGRTRQ
jgi:hypothetical protein